MVDFGDLERDTPFSKKFGYDRGGPVDRIYIEKFMAENAHYVKGNVLEIGDNDYTIKYGGQNVLKSDILHINHENPNATIIGDLTKLSEVADNTFDCIILTQTLHLIFNFQDALITCRRILKPGGCLLLTVPGLANIDHSEWGSISYYNFTTNLMERVCKDIFPNDNSEVKHYGNILTVTAYLYGLGVPEINPKHFDIDDYHYQLTISTKIIKNLS
jgi:SAM-dependent methyltransferase